MSFLTGGSSGGSDDVYTQNPNRSWWKQNVNQGDLNEYLNSTQGQASGTGLKGMTDVIRYKDGSIKTEDNKTDISSTYGSFLGWIAAKQSTDAAHAEWAQQMAASPGKQATLLSGLAANAEKTVIGAPTNPNKTPTILGGL